MNGKEEERNEERKSKVGLDLGHVAALISHFCEGWWSSSTLEVSGGGRWVSLSQQN